MKLITGLIVLVCAVALASAKDGNPPIMSRASLLSKPPASSGDSCSGIVSENVPDTWISMPKNCQAHVELQIKEEIKASIAYLKMAAHFSRDTVNLPGFAELFFKAAREEREHGIHLIEYLSMRGKLVDSVTNLIQLDIKGNPSILADGWSDNLTGAQALKVALDLEAHVTKSINKLIGACEHEKDHHLVDYLSGTYLEEQHKGQRDLAGKLSTLDRMYKTKGPLAEFLFDKEL